MPDFKVEYNTHPNVMFSNHRYYITFDTGSDYRPESHTSVAFHSLWALREYVERWDNDPPLKGWTIKSIQNADPPQCPEHDPAYCNQCAEDEYR